MPACWINGQSRILSNAELPESTVNVFSIPDLAYLMNRDISQEDGPNTQELFLSQNLSIYKMSDPNRLREPMARRRKPSFIQDQSPAPSPDDYLIDADYPLDLSPKSAAASVGHEGCISNIKYSPSDSIVAPLKLAIRLKFFRDPAMPRRDSSAANIEPPAQGDAGFSRQLPAKINRLYS